MDMKATSPSRPPLGFLDTPLEIRREIYRYCLLRRHPVSIHDPHYPVFDEGIRKYKNSLLLVSRQVGSEALVVLYGENIFRVFLDDWGELDLKGFFAEANIGRVRRLEIVTPSSPYPSFEVANYTYMLDFKIWSPFLANLTKLSIVVDPPIQFRTHDKGLEKKKTLEWLRINLQDVASHLSHCCIVEVDDDNSEETRAVLGESFPGGYRKVQTLLGDAYIRRNRM
ncbi:hypothetical protein BDR22DRAFT_859112 [Usnea florida]